MSKKVSIVYKDKNTLSYKTENNIEPIEIKQNKDTWHLCYLDKNNEYIEIPMHSLAAWWES